MNRPIVRVERAGPAPGATKKDLAEHRKDLAAFGVLGFILGTVVQIVAL